MDADSESSYNLGKGCSMQIRIYEMGTGQYSSITARLSNNLVERRLEKRGLSTYSLKMLCGQNEIWN